ncbi:NDUFAF3 domain-containing protein [Dioscorea alata]|uniref:NDUFAF3 domain-containing protein n=1 Tax=Dioscorea alata TaxID=55571 RepID=A0ACB7UW90_DIOAL|nr:NDUFAF3 domain-containing protein [Dioscorea alata]
MGSLGENGVMEITLSSLDPVFIELNRLENSLREKERELGTAQREIKALKMSEVLKDKAVAEMSNELEKMEEKLSITEKHLEFKSLEIKKLNNSKKEAMAAQFAAEATLRRLHASQKDEELVPLEAVIAPLESDIKIYKNEIIKLQEDNKALERLTKSKEEALIEAEEILRSALERVLIVEQVQNQNLELRRKIEIFQEENKLLERTNRQKVIEIEKLSQTIRELEESILAGAENANAIRDFQRQVAELHEEKKTLERELARVKVSVNRVASVKANEFKDDNEKLMPVKHWLDERKFFQGEIQRLRDKLQVSERTCKAENQLNDKLRLRLRTLEESMINKKSSTNRYVKGINLVAKNLWVTRSKISDDNLKENSDEISTKEEHGNEDMVSGFLYDKLQQEVINLRKSHEAKDGLLNAKEDEIKKLLKNLETLRKTKKIIRREPETVMNKSKDQKQKKMNSNISNRNVKHFRN